MQRLRQRERERGKRCSRVMPRREPTELEHELKLGSFASRELDAFHLQSMFSALQYISIDECQQITSRREEN